jgi:universal stress protein E
LHESIIKRAVALGVDCILKPLRHHGLLRQLLFTATDWQLVRQCPLPLWLVSHFYQLSGKPILAAVDVAETDAEHLALNQRVLQQAVAVAVMLHGSLHMVNASGLTPLVGLAEPLAYDSAERFKLHQVAVALQVAASYQIEPERVHCEQGSVDRVINYWSHQIDAGIIVLGDTTRAGLRSLLGGGVAEAVMSKTDSDVLIVKPGSESLPIAAR